MTDKFALQTNNSLPSCHPVLRKCVAFTLAEVFSPHCAGSRKFAFTLAEVLITLGIIGIVAAMTLPNLIANYQKNQTVVQLKKVYSDLNNVVKRSEIDNGPMKEWEYPNNACYNYECIEPFIKKYYLPYFSGAKLVRSSASNDYSPEQLKGLISNYLILNNGTMLYFYASVPSNFIWLFADLNGKKGPNQIGRDIFVFEAYRSPNITFWGNEHSKSLLTSNITSGIFQDGSRYSYSCSTDNSTKYRNFFCGRLIELNDWKIPDDYPW